MTYCGKRQAIVIDRLQRIFPQGMCLAKQMYFRQ